MACCSGASGCRCVELAAADDGCSAVRATVTGAGSSATPYVIGTTTDLTRLVRLDGNEPWTVDVVSGCSMIVPRCIYSMV